MARSSSGLLFRPEAGGAPDLRVWPRLTGLEAPDL